MMRGLVDSLERHHNVRILNEAVIDSVRLSGRYVTGRQLPDKAVSVLDTTCARIAISQSATPPAVEDCRRRIEHLKTLIAILEREAATGSQNDAELADLESRLEQAQRELEQVEQRWNQEKELVAEIGRLRARLEERGAPARLPQEVSVSGNSRGAGSVAVPQESRPSGSAPAAETDDGETARLRDEFHRARAQLKQLQGHSPLVHYCVDSQAIAETIAAWTGIPLGRMVADEIKTVLNLKALMEQSIIGQSHALDAIAQSVRSSRANLSDPRTPVGVFLLAGPSGVGKTETAITLANLLYGGDQNMTVINMSEFKEEHKVSLLMGSPPGYVGYGEGGVLTEAVRRKPYSVLLLDEIEKAHPGVQDIFYQVFDKGTLRDGEGRDIDFKNTLILMTTNAGSDLTMSLCSDPDTAPDAAGLSEALFPELLKTFKPAFLGRLVVIPYYPLRDDVMKQIIRLKLGKIGQRVETSYRAQFAYAPEVVDHIAARCTEVQTGARNVDHILSRTLLPELSAEFLARMSDGQPIERVEVKLTSDGRFQYEISGNPGNNS
jgi:type VI secretion system protein VasG